MTGDKPRKSQKGGGKGKAAPDGPSEPRKKPGETPQQPVRGSGETPQQPRKTQKEYQRAASAPSIVDRKRIDPLIKVSFVCFLLASLVVVGVTVYDKNFASGDPREAVFGDTVMVEYTGSVNDYYDGEGNPAIFDTNVKSIYDSDDYPKAAGYEMDSFDLLEVKMTDPPNVIKPFRDALFGKKVGETVRLKAPADQAYPTVLGKIALSDTATIPIVMGGLTKDKAKTYLRDAPADLQDGERLTTVFGWDALVHVSGYNYTLSHLAAETPAGEAGYAYSDEMNLKVTSVVDNEITYEYALTEKGRADVKSVGVRMLIDGEERLIVEKDGILYHKAKLSDDDDLYFVVKIIEFK